MGKDTGISWCHHTFNPWWGCTKVSAGCANCYAQTTATRWGHKVWGDDAGRRTFGDKHWAEPISWDATAERDGVRRRVFCGSMCDVFEDRDDLRLRRLRLFNLIMHTPALDWLLLTKRPENALRLIGQAAFDCSKPGDLCEMLNGWKHGGRNGNAPDNVWIGATCENQEMADLRIPQLLSIPAKVRFLSCEPLLGPIDITHTNDGRFVTQLNGGYLIDCHADPKSAVTHATIDWVIVGGESGSKARPYDIAWARSIISQCKAAGVPVFHKQVGSNAFYDDPVHAELCDMRADPADIAAWMKAGERRIETRDRSGTDPADWPEDLRVQEFPNV